MKIQRKVTTQCEVVLKKKDILDLARKADPAIPATATVDFKVNYNDYSEDPLVAISWSETK